MQQWIIAVVLLASASAAEAQATGACCLPNGNCIVTDALTCFRQGGVSGPSGSTCVGVVCTGACCLANGDCASGTSPISCRNASGTFKGLGSSCVNRVCGGACCAENGDCIQRSPEACAPPRTFSGLGTSCNDVDCAGACCQRDGSCTETGQPDCQSANGVFQGLSAPCGSTDWAGACCLPDGSCVETSQPGCVQDQSGEFLGLTATCPTSVCTGACCLPDKGCIETGPNQCAQAGGTYQGRESVCGDDCPVATPTAFTYQGQIKRGSLPLNGAIDARFSLWLSPTGQDPPNQIGSTVAINAIEVANGLFSVDLDFGQNAFNGNARWLEVEIYDHADPPGTSRRLTPRHSLTPTPYALQTRGIVVTDNGNVGIGTKTPTSKLEIAAQDGSAITGPQPFLTLRDTTGGGAVTIGNSGGNVGIGTTAPNAGLHVKKEPIPPGGTLTLEGTTHTYMTFFPDGMAAGRKGYFGFASATTSDITIANEQSGGHIIVATPGSQVYATGGEENLRIVRGVISGAGGIIVGSGFQVSHIGTGHYTITFDTPFTGPSSVTATLDRGGVGNTIIQTQGVTGSTVDLVINTSFHSGENPYDEAVHFIAIGPR